MDRALWKRHFEPRPLERVPNPAPELTRDEIAATELADEVTDPVNHRALAELVHDHGGGWIRENAGSRLRDLGEQLNHPVRRRGTQHAAVEPSPHLDGRLAEVADRSLGEHGVRHGHG